MTTSLSDSVPLIRRAVGVNPSQVKRNSQRLSHLSPAPSGSSAFGAGRSSFLSQHASVRVHEPSHYLDPRCVLLINHLSSEPSRSCIIASCDDGNAAYFHLKNTPSPPASLSNGADVEMLCSSKAAINYMCAWEKKKKASCDLPDPKDCRHSKRCFRITGICWRKRPCCVTARLWRTYTAH